MKNVLIIDFFLCVLCDMIVECGNIVGFVFVVWFCFVWFVLVGGVWVLICIYMYCYLLLFNEVEMLIEQIVFYVISIVLIVGMIVMWLIVGCVVYLFVYWLCVLKMLWCLVSVKVCLVLLIVLVSECWCGMWCIMCILVVLYDVNGLILGIEWVVYVGLQFCE